jgi:hypothetical protein
MPREASLFETAGGSPVRGYLLMKNVGNPNIPPNWIERARASRKSREKNIAELLATGKPKDILAIEEWEEAFRKEQFYLGIRILLELERKGKTTL